MSEPAAVAAAAKKGHEATRNTCIHNATTVTIISVPDVFMTVQQLFTAMRERISRKFVARCEETKLS